MIEGKRIRRRLNEHIVAVIVPDKKITIEEAEKRAGKIVENAQSKYVSENQQQSK